MYVVQAVRVSEPGLVHFQSLCLVVHEGYKLCHVILDTVLVLCEVDAAHVCIYLQKLPLINYLFPVLSKYNTAPKFSANTKAASFPLGNISPYNKSSIDIHVFDCRFEEVPLIDDDQEVILKYAFFMFMLYF
jgi:hypothetical protein